jgi:raffinose/stachyose/melibiose transport system permease protein
MANMTRHFGISILVTATTTIIVVLFSSLAAFSFSRLRYRGRNILFSIFFIGLILPIQSFLVGLFVLFRSIGLLNTVLAMILPGAGMGLSIAIVIMKYYFDTLPTTLEESAYMDGAGTFLVYRVIVMPISAAIVITVSIFTTINAWNEFLIPFVMVQNQQIRPLTTSLFVFATRFSAQYTLLFAALCIIVTPMFIIYFVFQKQVQSGITAGALKE